MNTPEFENYIRKTLRRGEEPNRVFFTHMLSQLTDTPVTESTEVRYTKKTATSNIISNKLSDIIAIWKSKRVILVPSFILLFFIGAFSLSPHIGVYTNSSLSIQQLAEQDETIEETGVDTDDQLFLASFEEPGIIDLTTTTNEL